MNGRLRDALRARVYDRINKRDTHVVAMPRDPMKCAGDAVAVFEEWLDEAYEPCPIGQDTSPEFCSAGTCSAGPCVEGRIERAVHAALNVDRTYVHAAGEDPKRYNTTNLTNDEDVQRRGGQVILSQCGMFVTKAGIGSAVTCPYCIGGPVLRDHLENRHG